MSDIFSELRAYRETFPSRLTVMQCDAAIQSVISYEPMDGEEIPQKMPVVGRGGTDFRPVFDWIRDNAMGAYLIYATDGYGAFPDSEETGGVIWLLSKYSKHAAEFPFGACVKV